MNPFRVFKLDVGQHQSYDTGYEMNIILSRKGFDLTYGGVPSPILPDGTLLSLPIPRKSSIRYDQITIEGHSLGKVVHDLTVEKFKSYAA